MLKPLLNLLVYFFVPLVVPTVLFNVYLTFLADYFSQVNILFIILIISVSVLVGIFLSILAYENYVFKRKLLATLIISCISSSFLFLSLGLSFSNSIKLPIVLSYFLAFSAAALFWNSKVNK